MSKKVLLTQRDINKVLKKYTAWNVNKKNTRFSGVFDFDDYISALAFVARISVHAEVLKHHPVIELSYGKVKIHITTHKLKGLTKLDIALLERINTIVDKGV
ncbi:4a-hydroxytetrahydrobiopterin dehydratase [Candidatus Pacebacteria bacterium]|nr:4a-hydroxytetrahydrobiopterin dehydratase [Candidatus Paceibacterota bacterium]